MKIVCVGDSWTEGYGIENKNDTWPYLLARKLNSEVIVGATLGSSNQNIAQVSVSLVQKYKPDLLIVGWSGVTRYVGTQPQYHEFSLSYVVPELSDKRTNWFETHSLDDLLEQWENQISRVNQITDSIIMFSVFGDRPKNRPNNFLKMSFLEYLAHKQGIFFLNDIPIFEFDFLHENNLVTKKFAEKYFPKNWERACVERESLRNSEHFLICGHPNKKGHEVWANFLYEEIKYKFGEQQCRQ